MPPNWDGKLWKADGDTSSIRWKNTQGEFDVIFANDPDFSSFVCTSIDDYIKIVRIIDSCRDWESYITKKRTLRKLKDCFRDRR